VTIKKTDQKSYFFRLLKTKCYSALKLFTFSCNRIYRPYSESKLELESNWAKFC